MPAPSLVGKAKEPLCRRDAARRVRPGSMLPAAGAPENIAFTRCPLSGRKLCKTSTTAPGTNAKYLPLKLQLGACLHQVNRGETEVSM